MYSGRYGREMNVQWKVRKRDESTVEGTRERDECTVEGTRDI
jgi:hypothetical protein